jgi:predicted RNA-binding protein Jag
MGNGRDRFKRERGGREKSGGKIERILTDVQSNLQESHKPEVLKNLNSFERKQIHRFFDDKPDFETKTYRTNGDFVLKVYPIGKIKELARDKAAEAVETHNMISLPCMGSYERFIVHDTLKDMEQIETKSNGEGVDRRVEIHPVRFGRGLKKIMKKIKLM